MDTRRELMCRTFKKMQQIGFLLIAAAACLLAAGSVMAQSPPNCTSTCLNTPSITPVPNQVLNGEQVTFSFSVQNRDVNLPPGFTCCDANQVTVLLCCPGPNGLEQNPQCVGGSNNGLRCTQDSNCPGGTCNVPSTCVVKDTNVNFFGDQGGVAGTGQVRSYTQACTINVNAGV